MDGFIHDSRRNPTAIFTWAAPKPSVSISVSPEDYGGLYNLRFDDTNPTKEDVEYVESIKDDIRWLGFDWEDREFSASDYFEQLYGYAVQLIEKGAAYVCDLSPEEIRYGKYRGTLTEPGLESPYRNRSVEENLDLFERMRKREFEEGSRTLRAKIDMSSPNLTMRDPVMYRILYATHHETGDRWCIYPMYVRYALRLRFYRRNHTFALFVGV